MDQDKEGDVLILDPERPRAHIGGIGFDKQIGRKEDY